MDITLKNPAKTYSGTILNIDKFMSNVKNCLFPTKVEPTLSPKICFKCLQLINEDYAFIRANLETGNSTTVVYLHDHHYN